MKNPERRPPEQKPEDVLPREVLEYEPAEKLNLNKRLFVETLRKTPRGSAGGLSGLRFEHLKVLLDESSGTDLLYSVARDLARCDLPRETQEVLRTGSLIALQKPDGGVRGTVVEEALRRLTAKTLAKQYCADFEKACAHQGVL